MYRGLFGLTASQRRSLEPLPLGASTAQLVNRLYHLERLRAAEFLNMEAPEATIIDIARHQADVTLISAAMQATTLRARTAWMRSAATRFPTGIPLPLKAWFDEYLKKKLTRTIQSF